MGFDLNSTSFDWVEIPHDFFPEEQCKKARNLNHTLLYNDPVHAVITLEGTTITIDGMESSFYMGVDRSKTKDPYLDHAAREYVPKVQSAKFTLL